MPKMKQNKKYYFTVEGETEKWYLEWLQKTINDMDEALFKVNFDCKIEKNPMKRARSITIPTNEKIEIYHISDYESSDDIHTKQFIETMDNLKEAKKLGKQINYKFGYTNFTFDLWIILHKSDCNSEFTHRSHYIRPINSAFGEKFENMDQYKHEANFKRVLSKLTIQDVVIAINRATKIMEVNTEKGYTLHHYKGYSYYKENPSLMIWEPIKKILNDCGLV